MKAESTIAMMPDPTGTTPGEDPILLLREGAVTRLVLNRPSRRNAVSLAKDLLSTGRLIGPVEALAMGLIDSPPVFPDRAVPLSGGPPNPGSN